jgi:EAL domain-containing protein (putative c-di-GMP-specific phosphodiesterase class I)
LTATEARRRWPAEPIPIIERTDLIFGVDAWVLNKACPQLSLWRGAGLAEDVSICVNSSATQLKATDFLQTVDRALAETGTELQALVLEITETILTDDIEASVALLRSLHNKGVRVATHDFGTGFSSLGYLQRLPIGTLKTDRSSIRDITKDAGSAAIAEAAIKLGKTFGLQVIAEGVKTAEQLRFVKRQGCNAYQGFLYSPPVSAHAMAPVLQRHPMALTI